MHYNNALQRAGVHNGTIALDGARGAANLECLDYLTS